MKHFKVTMGLVISLGLSSVGPVFAVDCPCFSVADVQQVFDEVDDLAQGAVTSTCELGSDRLPGDDFDTTEIDAQPGLDDTFALAAAGPLCFRTSGGVCVDLRNLCRLSKFVSDVPEVFVDSETLTDDEVATCKANIRDVAQIRNIRCTGPEKALPVVNDLISLDGASTAFDGNDGRAPAGVFTITAVFTNTSSTPIRFPFFEVAQLTAGNLLLNADGGPGGVGATSVGDNADQVLLPGESVTANFEIGLQTTRSFTFFVNFRGEPIL